MMPEARHRKPRGEANKDNTSEEIPLAQPSRDKPTEKTLLQQAEERTKELARDQKKAPGQRKAGQFVHPLLNPDGTVYAIQYGDATDEEMGELQESILYGVSLTMIFFTMNLMVYSQYADEKDWRDILSRTFIALGILMVLSVIMHPRAEKWYGQAIFLAGSLAAGCYLVSITSTQSTLAVMRSAPAVGTLWIWAVVEQRSDLALGSLAAVAAFYYFEGYSIFN